MMFSAKRAWFLPAVAITLILYYFYRSSAPSSQPFPVLHGTSNEDQVFTGGPVHVVPGPERYPVKSFAQLPSGSARQLPKVQHAFLPETGPQKEERVARQSAIKDAFMHTWKGYKQHAWGYDELRPLSGRKVNPYGGWGATLVDSLSTLWMMGFKQEFEEAVEAVHKIDFSTSGQDSINIFETTIRYLGGLLSAYDVSEHKYPVLLDKAVELANILYMVFDTESRMPTTRWKWRDSIRGLPVQASRSAWLAEIGSLNVEFTRLAQLTGDHKWFDAVERPTNLLYNAQDTTKIPGLWPTVVDTITGNLSSYDAFTMGGTADSAYEYVTKEYVLLGGLDERYQQMYTKVIAAAKEYLFFRPLVPGNPDILMSGSAIMRDGKVHVQTFGQHLSCFTGGMVALSAKIFERPEDLAVAKQLVDGCVWAYNSTPSGLMPETFFITACDARQDKSELLGCEWSEDKWYTSVTRDHGGSTQQGETQVDAGKRIVKQESLLPAYSRWMDHRYILRPEAIESVFYYYRITGDRAYLDEAWQMWTSIDSACKTPIAYAALNDVRVKSPTQSDRMESFWLAETLKYFFMLYSDPKDWSLDDWVLNTEAHPLRRPRAGESLIRL